MSNACVSEWSCSAWSECVDGKIKRTCSQLNDCSNYFMKPTMSETCIGKPESVGLSVDNTEENYDVIITLYDSVEQPTSDDSKIEFILKDESDTILYFKNVTIEKSKFLEGKYSMTIPISEVNKGYSHYGVAEIKVISNNKIMYAKDIYISIPYYTDAEINQMMNSLYLKNAISLNQKIRKGNFEVTLLKYGNSYEYSFGKYTPFLRVDFLAKNIGVEQDSIYTYNSVLINGESQFDLSYSSTFIVSNIYPDIIREGYMLYDVNKQITGPFTIILGKGYDNNYNEVIYSFDIFPDIINNDDMEQCKAIENHPELDYPCVCIPSEKPNDMDQYIAEQTEKFCRCDCEIGNNQTYTAWIVREK